MKHLAIFIVVPIALGMISLFIGSTKSIGHSILSVSPAEFSPGSNSCYYINSGMELYQISQAEVSSCGYYYAGLQLPDGVTITKLIFYWKDGSNLDAVARIARNNLNGTPPLYFDYAATNGDGNVASSSSITTSILVDNSQYSYFLRLDIPDDNLHVYSIQVEYDYTIPAYLTPLYLPVIARGSN